ncbi:hypothetical protein BT96DRAFT_946150 [Gymnopus androsaceus JB14]|uniref:Uncharacterized protein n=1 Tax=Gymnopus androsaceus JB14 TaxID=1447944 RepID=A0A6A4GY77_9AGAR|nr:hypothetical protein BT96DRAFT_946150 [Gymnopus androsaceus JB14]
MTELFGAIALPKTGVDDLQDTFEVFNFIAYTNADKFQQDMWLTYEQDHTELVAKLDQLLASDQRILDTLQDHGGLQRRMEELLIAVYKYVKYLGLEQSLEAKFL